MIISASNLIQEIHQRLFDKIDIKSSWSKNELKTLILDTFLEVVSEHLEIH